MLRQAFRGGNTHANRRYVGKICENVISYDMTSCYPAQQVTKKFPMRPFKFLDGDLSINRSMKYIGLGYEIIYFNMIEDRFLEDENFKYFGPFWVTFDKAYIKTVGEFYSSLTPEEKEFYGNFEDVFYDHEFEILFGSKDSSIYEYYDRLINIYQTDERLNDGHREFLYKLISDYFDNHSSEMSDNIKDRFNSIILGRDFSPVK